VKGHRTIPLDLEDWLHGFQTGLEDHQWLREIAGYRHYGREQELDLLEFAGRLASSCERDNIAGMFAI
jgi:hypothetical protein